ncbi:MAG: ribosome small subunit-dependent GTPase A [Chloroflexi bacterium RBG_16_54_11]|nr:MAG: ribosome small subunit-dependent GTPase A [Chloroflexi bacterium RBG_16_54_11]
MRGLIVRCQSGFYTVETETESLSCHLRGRLKKSKRQGDIVAVGDWVQITRLENGMGTIEAVEARRHLLSRMSPTPGGEYQQIIIANPDQAVFVFACAKPALHPGLLDRLLVVVEKQGIPALIVANKVDLVSTPRAQELFSHYEALGYPLLYTSTKSGFGIPELALKLKGRLSVLAGPSGAGKSSLLNSIQPGLGLAVRAISPATDKGRHTTVVRQLFRLDGGGYVADTPGLKAMALWDIRPEELDGYFPELRGLVADCQFSDCTHVHEPGCAVQAALAKGEIHPERYASYVRMRLGQEE